MTYKSRFAGLVLFACWTSSALAIPLQCAEDDATNALFCFAPSELRENGGIRSAPLFMGGPKEITRSAYSIAANCSTGVMHLKDRKGVSFGGSGPGEGTKQSRELSRIVCAAPLAPPKAKK